MSKHCTVCNQEYADELEACPHCAAAKKTHLANRPENRSTQLADINPAELSEGSIHSDADVQVSHHTPGVEPVSGASSVAWSELVEEPNEEVKVDAPSDADILMRHGQEPAHAADDESELVVAELASDAGHVEIVEDVEPASPDVRLHEPGAEAVEASIDPGTPAAELNEDAALDAVVVAEDSSSVNLGDATAGSGEAWPEVQAEDVVESTDSASINLEGLSVPETSRSGGPIPSDSSVDLGSHADIVAPPLEEDVGEQAASEAEVNELLAGLDRTPEQEEHPGLSQEEAAEIAEGERAIADAEAEEEAARADEETESDATQEEKPPKPTKARSRMPSLVGGTFLGIVLGAGGLIGARFAGIDVPAMIGVADKPKQSAAPIAPQPARPTFEARAAHVIRGDWDEAARAGIEDIDENKPNELAARGSFLLGKYLQTVGAKINPQDPALQPALKDLQKAAELKNPDAIYDLGLVNELAGKLKEARAEYSKGVQAFPDDAEKKRRFQSAIDRVELKEVSQGAGAALLPLERVEDRAVVLALLLLGLQPPPAPPVEPAKQPDNKQTESQEAGYEFWQASKLARQGKYGDAINALERARTLHDQRRFARLRKSQNPLSDPAEEIFLRCCDELKEYWRLENRLRDGGYLTDKNTPAQAMNVLMQRVEASDAIVKDLTDKFTSEKIIARPADLSKGVDRLLSEKKKAQTDIADLTGKLKKATDDTTALAGKLKKTEDTLKDRESKLKLALDEAVKLKATNENLNASLKKIADDLAAAKLFDPKGKEKIADAVKKAVEVATIKDPQGMIRQQRSEIARLSESLKQRWLPEEMMPLWLLLLDENRNQPELNQRAMMDVERLKADPRATAMRRGEAEVVLGLALRNAEKFAEAKNVLASARSAVDKGDWLARANAAFKDVSDPAAYYATQAQLWYDHGRMDAALAVMGRALKILPASERGKLLARRSLIELDAARAKSKGTLASSDPMLAAARQDAADAAKAGFAEGHYAAGRIAEAMGQWDAAIDSYRKALAAHPVLDAEGGRYRMALARVLLQPREIRPGQPPILPVPTGEKIGWSDRAPYPAGHVEDRKRLLALLLIGLQPPLLPGEEPGLEEAEKLADEVLKAPANTIPFTVRAQALAVKGRWNNALQTYVEGIRPMLPREYGDGLTYLILNHPRLKRPDSLRIPNPMEAEKHFAAGLNHYFGRDYANAEREFLSTIENDSQDARFFYYLGLSRMALNRRRDAYDDFEQGATLERLNRPSSAAVSESLERIQGPIRSTLNNVRTRPQDNPARQGP